MTAAELWGFVREQGLLGKEIGGVVLGVVFLGTGIWGVVLARKTPLAEATYATFVSPLIAFGVSAACFFVVWTGARERYLLRPGAGRYTVATVYKRNWQRGKRHLACAYFVAGRCYQTGENCGSENGYALPCRPVGARYYVYFSPERPATQQVLAVPVPDTLQRIPLLGWAKLP